MDTPRSWINFQKLINANSWIPEELLSIGCFWKSNHSVKKRAPRCWYIFVFMWLLLLPFLWPLRAIKLLKIWPDMANRWHECPWGKIFFYNNKTFPKVYSYADEDSFCLFLDQAEVDWICLLEEEFCLKHTETKTSADVRVSLTVRITAYYFITVGWLWIYHCWCFLYPHI